MNQVSNTGSFGRASANQGSPRPSTGSNRELFENEKQRIVQSCFSRTDQDGQLLECYITHVKVNEDAAFPSAPPPPNHVRTQDTRKSRVIIIAVRKSGRVRVHKARENSNGTFSIGKTWHMEELTQMENSGNESNGFTVTLVKPYYWEAQSIREKEAFVATLLRIFRKYTNGRSPIMVGFEGIPAVNGEARPSTSGSDLGQRDFSGTQQRQVSSQSVGSSSPAFTQPFSAPSGLEPPRHQLVSAPSYDSINSRRVSGPDASGMSTPSGTVRMSAQSTTTATINSFDTFKSTSSAPTSYQITSSPNGPTPITTSVQDKPVLSSQAGPLSPFTPIGGLSDAIAASIPGRRVSETNTQIQQRPSLDALKPRNESPQKSSPLKAAASVENDMLNGQENHEATVSSATPLLALPQALPQATALPARPSLPNKKSSKEIAAQFKLAASAYAAGGALAQGTRARSPLPSPSGEQTGATDGRSATPDSSRRPVDNSRGPVRVGGDSRHESIPKLVTTDSQESVSSQKSVGGPVLLRDPFPEKSTRRSDSPAIPTPVETPAVIEPRTSSHTHNLSIPNYNKYKEQGSLGVPDARDKRISTIDPKSLARTSSATKASRRRSTAAVVARNKYTANVDLTNLNVDIEAMLEEFEWDGRRKRIDALEADVKKELAKVESGNIWLNEDEDKTAGEERVQELSRLLDRAVKDCEELDGLLTLYAVELMSLNDDVAYIENQSQGLQVQTANQRTLQRELEILLATISIDPSEIVTLQGAKIQGEGLVAIEAALIVLYKAMLTIDPNLGRAPILATGNDIPIVNGGMGKMLALKDKKERYDRDSQSFLGRLVEYLKIKYRQDLMLLGGGNDLKEAMKKTIPERPIVRSHIPTYKSLFQFSGLIFFAKDVDISSYNLLVKSYTTPVRETFQEEFKAYSFSWKRLIKKVTQEDQEILFTHTDNNSDGVASMAVRTLTVKRSQTLAKSLRSDVTNRAGQAQTDGKVNAYEAFGGFLDDIIPIMALEQNFISEFFLMSSFPPASSFLEFAQNSNPDNREPEDLNRRRVPESDKGVAIALLENMVDVFGFVANEIQSFIDTSTRADPMQGVGILLSLERKANLYRESTNQEFIVKILTKCSDQLRGMFVNFLKEQVRAIEVTKVKIKKRKGVIDFMRTFPHFANKIEDQLPPEQSTTEFLEIREMVNNGYSILNRAMFDALQAIAKLSPQVASQSMDPEDKEQLNYHIMMIENMNHYVEEVDPRGNSILFDFKRKAETEYKEHLGLYISAVIRRPLGRLLDFVESVEAAEQTTAPETIILQASHSKSAFKKVLSLYDAKELKEGIKTLGKRVDKHFADSDDLNLSNKLINKVLRGVETDYLRLTNRVQILLTKVYRDAGLDMSWTREDITSVFNKLVR